MSSQSPKKIAVVLSGGGARGAYQAGVMRALTENLSQEKKHIQIITGTSAGAINAGFLASHWQDPIIASQKLCDLWSSLHAERVFKTDAFSLGKIGLKWALDTTLGSLYKKKMARSLLSTEPLHELLAEHIKLEEIEKNIESSQLESLAITAMDYEAATSISFVQSRLQQNQWQWDRFRRKGESAKISIDHIMASSAIPLFFPAIKVEDRYYGDGCVRNSAPISPAIHLGAEKLIVISVRRPDSVVAQSESDAASQKMYEPTIARVLGVIMNALLLDAIDFDMERLDRINQTVDRIQPEMRPHMKLRKLDYYWIRPSQDIGALAGGQYKQLPPVIRYLLGGLGSRKESSDITSYLLFEPGFCGKLVEMGYEDGRAHAQKIKEFVNT